MQRQLSAKVLQAQCHLVFLPGSTRKLEEDYQWGAEGFWVGTLPALGCDIMDSLRTATEQTQEAFLLQEGYGS